MNLVNIEAEFNLSSSIMDLPILSIAAIFASIISGNITMKETIYVVPIAPACIHKYKEIIASGETFIIKINGFIKIYDGLKTMYKKLNIKDKNKDINKDRTILKKE